MNRKYYIYKLYCEELDVGYVGVTIDLKKRLSKLLNSPHTNVKVKEIIKRLGKNSFKLLVLEEVQGRQKALEREKFYIATETNLLNISRGGEYPSGNILPVKVGATYGNITVIADSGKRSPQGLIIYTCKCVCGNICEYAGTNITRSRAKYGISCGCKMKQKIDPSAVTHNMSKTEIYKTWFVMKRRCIEKGHRDYKNYGKRGITIDKKWLTFEGFLEDIGKTYTKGSLLLRRDKTKGYCKENCFWGNRKQAAQNSRIKYLTLRGENKSMAAWAEDKRIKALGISYTLIRARKNILKWADEKALTTPVTKKV